MANSRPAVDQVVNDLNQLKPDQDFTKVATEIASLQQADKGHFQANLAEINSRVDMKKLGFSEDFQIVGFSENRLVARSEDGKQLEYRQLSNMNNVQAVDNAGQMQAVGDHGRQMLVRPDGSMSYKAEANKGDCYWRVAADVLKGRSGQDANDTQVANFVNELAAYNKKADPNKLAVGETIEIPPPVEIAPPKAAETPAATEPNLYDGQRNGEGDVTTPTAPATDNTATTTPTAPATDNTATTTPTAPATDNTATTTQTGPATDNTATTTQTGPATDNTATTTQTGPATDNTATTTPATDNTATTTPATDNTATTTPATDNTATTTPATDNTATTTPATDNTATTTPTAPATDNTYPSTSTAPIDSTTATPQEAAPAVPPPIALNADILLPTGEKKDIYNPLAPAGQGMGAFGEVWSDKPRGLTATRTLEKSETDAATGEKTNHYRGTLDNSWLFNWTQQSFRADETVDSQGNMTHRKTQYLNDWGTPTLTFQLPTGVHSIDHVSSVESVRDKATGDYTTTIQDVWGKRWQATNSADGKVTGFKSIDDAAADPNDLVVTPYMAM